MKNCYKDFCTGCGLCHDQQNVSFLQTAQGMMYQQVCPKNKPHFAILSAQWERMALDTIMKQVVYGAIIEQCTKGTLAMKIFDSVHRAVA